MPIIGVIKNGVKTKIAAKLPNLFPASRTTFDNTGTDLTSNRVEGAIKELDTPVGDNTAITYTSAMTDGATTFTKCGAFKCLSVYARIQTETTGSNVTIANLAAKARPTQNIKLAVPVSQNGNVTLGINTDGTVTYYSAENLKNWMLCFTVSYL